MDPTLPQSVDELRQAQERSLARLRPPGNVPGYEPQGYLGAGAYGEVWVAVDRNTGRKVAIKFYTHRGGLDWSLLSREVEKLAFLFNDRYVVQLIEVGWNAEPPYYVMEYLEGGSLADRLRSGPMPVREASPMFRDIAHGLVHAHNKGILHCDLKPANVLLDQDHHPRLADFGQSRLSNEQLPALGTLFYMAPEQADLKAIPDARWDVYALGALMYCMLTGQPPYRTESAATIIEQSTGVEDKLEQYRRLIHDSPAPRMHRQAPGVDRELVEIVDRCLRIDPNRRYANAQAVLDALAARSVRRGRRPLMLLGAVGPALLLLVTGLFAWHSFGTAVEQSHAAISRRALESNSFASQFVAENVASQINRRWEILEQLAASGDFRQLLRAASGQPRAHLARQRLQARIEALDAAHPEIVDAASWTVMSQDGVQLARSPLQESTIDRNYSHRDYFHGRGVDFDPSQMVRPIHDVHLSTVFVSDSSQKPKIALSVPVFDADEESAVRTVLGVVSTTVTLGNFAVLKTPDKDSRDQFSVLVDLKPDWRGRRGIILEHPQLSEKLSSETGDPHSYYLNAEDLERLDRLRAQASETDHAIPEQVDSYEDPLGGDYGGRWLAAVQPVRVPGRSETNRDTGWGVIVQERFQAAVSPVRALRDRLLWEGVLAFGVVLAVVAALWGFVAVILNESPRSRLVVWLRRRSGWTGPSLSQGSSAGGSSDAQEDEGSEGDSNRG